LSVIASASPDFLKAIEWLAAQPLERQSYLVALLLQNKSKDFDALPSDQKEMLVTIAVEVRTLLSIHSKETVITALAEKAVSETISRVLVEQLEKVTPTPGMDAQALSRLSTETFEAVARYIVVDFYLGGQKGFGDVSRELQVNRGILDACLRLIRDSILYPLFRGNLRFEQVNQVLLDLNLSQDKADKITELLRQHLEKLRETRLFDDLSRVREVVYRLRQGQEETLSVLKEILEVLKKRLEPAPPKATYG